MRVQLLVLPSILLGALACRSVERAREAEPLAPRPPPREPAGEAPPAIARDEIVVCGQRVHTGAPVVLWTEPPYYDATKSEPRFGTARAGGPAPTGLRYQPGRVRKVQSERYRPPPAAGADDTRTDAEREESRTEVLVPPGSHEPALLADVVDQFVLHFDVCGLSRTCFRVLQDERGLSVHFLLDIDGTIYQTLDVRDTAWHATKSNARSVGIEMANMGAHPAVEAWRLDDWYQRDALGTYIRIPPRVKETGLRRLGFVGRPARDERVVGTIQKQSLRQYDFTPEQYQSLVKLTAALCRELPRIAPDAPRDEAGAVVPRVLDDRDWLAFHGILGHYHVQENKNDPGPAFDWERFLSGVRARLGPSALPPR